MVKHPFEQVKHPFELMKWVFEDFSFVSFSYEFVKVHGEKSEWEVSPAVFRCFILLCQFDLVFFYHRGSGEATEKTEYKKNCGRLNLCCVNLVWLYSK
jgi:hypothetical protein